MDDKEIISEIKKGNKDVFRELILSHQKFVLNICYRFVNNIDDAHDISQEVFIEVYRTIGKFRGDSGLKTWLYRIAVNRSLNFIRDNKKSRSTDSYSENPQNIYDSTTESTPETDLEDKERKKVLTDAIDSLPGNQKAVFVLCKIEGMSYDEISKIMDLSVKAVESLLMRAKKNLQKSLLSYYSQS
jgi:RNA polymerase sigma-70 factor, ECF subfamily